MIIRFAALYSQGGVGLILGIEIAPFQGATHNLLLLYQGWQYQHPLFRSVLKEHGIIQSMSRKGNCYDNCIMETFFGRLKNEMYYGQEKEYDSFDSFSKAIDEYINYYNNERIQSKTKWMPPVAYRIASICSS